MKRVVACTMSALMVFGLVPQGVSAQGVNALTVINQLDLTKAESLRLDQFKKTVDSIVKSGQKDLEKNKKVELYAADEKVVVIVDVDTPSMVEKFEESNETDINDFIEENQEVRDDIQEKVDAVSDKVVDKVEASKDVEKVEVLYSYDTVFTGVAMEVEYGQLDTIKKVEGVKNAFVAAKYEVPEGQEITSPEIGTYMLTSRELISAGLVQHQDNLDYTGQGMVVAVLDTGISYRHAAFSTAPVNPSVTATSMADVLANVDLMAEDSYAQAVEGGVLVADGTSANSVFKSAKVPFGYDYNDNDTEITPVDSENHGTHVSGTIAGNSDVLKGVAPDAQLMGMKVFDNNGSTSDAVLFAALQDAVLLDVDVINMSLGSSSGFTVESNAALQQVYDLIEAVGINLDVSAGNAGTSAQNNNFGGLALTKNPSASTVGNPSTLAASLSVASMENTFLNFSHYILLADGTKMGYIDNGTAGKEFTTLAAGEYEYVNCGLGTPAEFQAVGDLTGKIALVKRGAISFTDKCANATAAGAKAMVLFNNGPGTISMSIDPYGIPAVSIDQAAGNSLVEAINADTKIGVFSYDPNQTGSLPSPSAGQMSDFSSWGPTPELTLKPEITAPGGNIYSSTQMSGETSQYGLMSGTSMAAPHMSGASALIKEYVEEAYPNLDPLAVENLVNSLAMSTAVPVIESGATDDASPITYYSPRKQGAGLVDVFNAITSEGYLSVDGSNRPKAELGSKANGKYEFLYTIHNQSDQTVIYDLSGVVQLEAYVNSQGYNLSTEESMNITDLGAKVKFLSTRVKNGKATVPANSSVEVRVNISIDKTNPVIAQYILDHPNGFFVEGFVFADNHTVKMNIPYMGFYGNFSKVPMFDISMYESKLTGEIPSCESGNIVYNDVSKKNLILGTNIFSQLIGEENTYSADQIAISTKSLGDYAKVLSTQTYLMKGAGTISYTFKNAKGKTVSQFTENNVSNGSFNSKYNIFIYAEAFMNNYPSFDGYDATGKALPEGQYSLTIKADPAVANGAKLGQKVVYSFALDNTSPVVNQEQSLLFEKEGNVYLSVNASDNDYLAGWEISALNAENKAIGLATKSFTHTVSEDGTKTHTILYNMGPKAALLAAGINLNSITISAYDYAMNYVETAIPMIEMPTVGNANVENAMSTAYQQVTIGWNLAENATGYRLYRADKADGQFVQIADLAGQDVLTYVDTNVKFGRDYFYKVCSYLNTVYMNEPIEILGEMSAATQVSTWTPKGTSIVFASSNLLGTSTFAWARVAGVTGYELYRKAVGEADYQLVRTLKGDRYVGCIDISSTQKGVKYSYVVKTYIIKNGVKYVGTPSQEIVLTSRRNFGKILGFFK